MNAKRTNTNCSTQLTCEPSMSWPTIWPSTRLPTQLLDSGSATWMHSRRPMDVNDIVEQCDRSSTSNRTTRRVRALPTQRRFARRRNRPANLMFPLLLALLGSTTETCWHRKPQCSSLLRNCHLAPEVRHCVRRDLPPSSCHTRGHFARVAEGLLGWPRCHC